jgi:hypothetical protein
VAGLVRCEGFVQCASEGEMYSHECIGDLTLTKN